MAGNWEVLLAAWREALRAVQREGTKGAHTVAAEAGEEASEASEAPMEEPSVAVAATATAVAAAVTTVAVAVAVARAVAVVGQETVAADATTAVEVRVVVLGSVKVVVAAAATTAATTTVGEETVEVRVVASRAVVRWVVDRAAALAATRVEAAAEVVEEAVWEEGRVVAMAGSTVAGSTVAMVAMAGSPVAARAGWVVAMAKEGATRAQTRAGAGAVLAEVMPTRKKEGTMNGTAQTRDLCSPLMHTCTCHR
jgi:hypothetical protein